MRKFLTAGAAGALITAGLILGSGAAAHADSCNGSPGVNPSYSDGANSGAQVCTPLGSLTAAGNQSNATGYVVADGNPSNPGAAAGYIGVENTTADGANVVGCSSGDYQGTDPESTEPTGSTDDTAAPGQTLDSNDNNVIVGQAAPPSANTLSGFGSGPCAASAP